MYSWERYQAWKKKEDEENQVFYATRKNVKVDYSLKRLDMRFENLMPIKDLD